MKRASLYSGPLGAMKKRHKKTVFAKLSGLFGGFCARYSKVLGVLGFCGLWFTSLYFLPINAAVLTTTAVGFGVYLAVEGKRRAFWERSVSFRLMEIMRAHSQPKDAAVPPAPAAQEVPAVKTYSHNAKRYDQIAEAGFTPSKKRLSPASRLGHSKNIRSAKAAEVNKARAEKIAVQAPAPAKDVFYSDSLIKGFIEGGLEKQSLQIGRTPIVRMPSGDAHLFTLSVAVETYAGTYLQADRYGPVAEAAGLNHRLYKAMVDGAMKAMKSAPEQDVHYSVAIDSAAFFDGAFMNGFIQKLRSERDMARRIILSLSHDDFTKMAPRALQIMQSLGQLGCQFMVSGVDSLEPDIELMQSAHVKSIMMPAKFLTAMLNNRAQFRDVIKARRRIEGSGLRVIVSGVNDRATMEQLKDLAPRHMQGALFNMPQPARLKAA